MSQVCVHLEAMQCLLYTTVAASKQPFQMTRAGPLAVNHDPVWSLSPLTGAGAQEEAQSAWATHLGGEIVLL